MAGRGPTPGSPTSIRAPSSWCSTAAAALGLSDPVPPARPAYAHLVVLGGLAHACLRRVAYAAHLLDGGWG